MRKKEGVIISEKLDGYFRERYAPLIAKGRDEEKTATSRNMLLAFLRGRFGKIPKAIEKAICQMNDPIALESLLARTANCKTLAEFEAEL